MLTVVLTDVQLFLWFIAPIFSFAYRSKFYWYTSELLQLGALVCLIQD